MDHLEQLILIEPVQGPTALLNPVVPVRKTDGSIGFCLDIHGANEAINHERNTIPKLDDILPELHDFKHFSKIDL